MLQLFLVVLKSLNLVSYVLLELRVKRFVSTGMSRVVCTYHLALVFLSIKGCEKNPLVSFRGNHFNIVFYDIGAVYYCNISEHIISFLVKYGRLPTNC